MYRIDNGTATTTLAAPTPVGPNPQAYWSDGDPLTATPATIVDAEWLNMIQEELCNVVTDDGNLGDDTLDKTKRDQLLLAIRREVSAGGGGSGGIGEAPNDGRNYVRNGLSMTWVPETTGGGGGNYVSKTGDTMSGALNVTATQGTTTLDTTGDIRAAVHVYAGVGYGYGTDFGLGIDPPNNAAAVTFQSTSSMLWFSRTTGDYNCLSGGGQVFYYHKSSDVFEMPSTGGFTIHGNAFKPTQYGTLWGTYLVREAENVADYSAGLKAICGLRPRTFEDDGALCIGLLPDEAKAAMPELVQTTGVWREDKAKDPEQVAAVNASPLLFAFVNALKEVSARLDAIEAKLGIA